MGGGGCSLNLKWMGWEGRQGSLSKYHINNFSNSFLIDYELFQKMVARIYWICFNRLIKLSPKSDFIDFTLANAIHILENCLP